MSTFDEQPRPAPMSIEKREKLIEKFIAHDLKLQDREAFKQQLRERQMKKRNKPEGERPSDQEGTKHGQI